MSAKAQVRAPFSPNKIFQYTIEEIDEQLIVISNLIKYGQKCERNKCLTKANEWLDKRLELINAS